VAAERYPDAARGIGKSLTRTASARPRILLVRLSAIGDIVFASPLIRALRRAYPQAHLAWLVQPENCPLLDAHPELDEVIVWPVGEWRELWHRRQWVELLGCVRGFRAGLARRRFDLAIDLQGLLKSGLLTWLSGAPERLGLGSREGSGLLMSRVVARGGDADLIGSEYRFLAERLGLPVQPFSMEVGLTEADEAFARELAVCRRVAEGYAVLCPFTTRPQKHWFADRWRDLARRLQVELGLPSLILGGPGDRGAAAALSLATPEVDGMLNLVGETTLREAAALIKHARLLIGVDTGLSHMGIAFGRPSLLLFGSTCPYRETTRGNARVLYHALPCSPCRRRPTCSGDFTCMKAIGVAEVVEAARALLTSVPAIP
jgi:heptosyltransferase I